MAVLLRSERMGAGRAMILGALRVICVFMQDESIFKTAGEAVKEDGLDYDLVGSNNRRWGPLSQSICT